MLTALVLASIVLGGNDQVAVYAWPVDALTVCIDEPTSKQANVTAEQNGSVSFTGTVSVDKSPVNYANVNFTAVVEAGWKCTVSPNPIVIKNTYPHSFNVTVNVPQATLADTVGHLWVTAVASVNGHIITQCVCATVTVAPYFKYSIVSDSPSKDILPKGGTSFTYIVRNVGNAFDFYELEIVNARELKHAGWSVNMSNKTITNVPPGGEANVSITVRSSQDWSWDLWISRPTSIIVVADSLAARNNTLTQTMPLRVYVKGYNNPLLEMITTLIILSAVCVALSTILWRRRKKGIRASLKKDSISAVGCHRND